MNLQRKEHLLVADQAADWMLRLKTGGPEVHAGLLSWLRASPLHVQEFMMAGGVDDALQALDPERSVDVDALIARAHAKSKVVPFSGRLAVRLEATPQGSKIRRLAGIAAGLGALTLVTIAAWIVYFDGDRAGIYATELGEQRILSLKDGSVVVLNTQSRIQVRFSERARDIYLDAGQALFEVRHDAARPFRVHAADTVIQAIGTQFDVHRFADRTTVAVVEGTVEVSANKLVTGIQPSGERHYEPARVTAGESATVGGQGEVELSRRVDTEAATAWRHQRLVFLDTSLADIASEFNRYNVSPRLRVEGEEMTSRVFTGSFNAHSPESFLAYLTQQTDLIVERRGKDTVILAPSTRSFDQLSQPPNSTR